MRPNGSAKRPSRRSNHTSRDALAAPIAACRRPGSTTRQTGNPTHVTRRNARWPPPLHPRRSFARSATASSSSPRPRGDDQERHRPAGHRQGEAPGGHDPRRRPGPDPRRRQARADGRQGRATRSCTPSTPGPSSRSTATTSSSSARRTSSRSSRTDGLGRDHDPTPRRSPGGTPTLAKQLIFDETARRSLKRGIDRLADAVKVTHRPEGPQRRPRQEVRLADDHQRRRHHRPRHRARGPVREHGRAAPQGSRDQDRRRRRRRHDHRGRPRPGDRRRGPPGRHRRRQPDGRQARHREGRRGGRRRDQEAVAARSTTASRSRPSRPSAPRIPRSARSSPR